MWGFFGKKEAPKKNDPIVVDSPNIIVVVHNRGDNQQIDNNNNDKATDIDNDSLITGREAATGTKLNEVSIEECGNNTYHIENRNSNAEIETNSGELADTCIAKDRCAVSLAPVAREDYSSSPKRLSFSFLDYLSKTQCETSTIDRKLGNFITLIYNSVLIAFQYFLYSFGTLLQFDLRTTMSL